MSRRRSSALRKEDEETMETATPLREVVSEMHSSYVETLPTIEEQQDVATTPHRNGVQLTMQQMLHHLREGRNLGPLTVLLIVLIYSLLSPHLPAPVHEYIYHIAH